jgi:RNA polymerase sigma-70 factor, ECF subfamily
MNQNHGRHLRLASAGRAVLPSPSKGAPRVAGKRLSLWRTFDWTRGSPASPVGGAKRDGDRAAVHAEMLSLYGEHTLALLSYACKLAKDPALAQDAVQEAFLRYYVARTRNESKQSAKAWLFRVARNYVLDRLRSPERRHLSGDGMLSGVSDARQHPESEAQTRELERRIEEMLSPREWECMKLRAEGLKYREIADVMGVECGTVGALVSRAVEKLRKRI